MSSTNFGSILIFASCVVGTCSILPGMWASFSLMGGVLLLCLKIYQVRHIFTHTRDFVFLHFRLMVVGI